MNWLKTSIQHQVEQITIAPLVVYRVLFGLMLFYGGIHSILEDDILVRFITPKFFFKYYGLNWVGYVGEQGIYILYGIWLGASLLVLVGLFYRVAIIALFFAFTYLHLLDATNYINHYYAISIFALFLVGLPANAAGSIDVWLSPKIRKKVIPQWYLSIFKWQVTIIYIGAAIAKMNTDWLLYAMPMRAWLLQQQDFPLLGVLFQYNWVHYVASWVGLLFDLTIVGWLIWKPTKRYAYLAVLGFHLLTGLLFNIGLFPFLMIITTTLFLPIDWHQKLVSKFDKSLIFTSPTRNKNTPSWIIGLLTIHFVLQIIIPFRHWCYEGDAIWTEEGYRFSWWVMRAEKDGYATFYVKDRLSNRKWEVTNSDFLTPFQEKRMAIRPDHILQYAHHLSEVYSRRYGLVAPIVTADVFVTINGRASQRLVDPNVNLTAQMRKLQHYEWILLYPE